MIMSKNKYSYFHLVIKLNIKILLFNWISLRIIRIIDFKII